MFGGARDAVLICAAPGAPAVLIRDASGEEMFLLGDVSVLSPETAEELESARCGGSGSGPLRYFCRMGIPGSDPLAACFDLSDLISADMESGEAEEFHRPGLPRILLRSLVSKEERRP